MLVCLNFAAPFEIRRRHRNDQGRDEDETIRVIPRGRDGERRDRDRHLRFALTFVVTQVATAMFSAAKAEARSAPDREKLENSVLHSMKTIRDEMR